LLPIKYRKKRTEFEILCEDVFECGYDDQTFSIDEPRIQYQTKKFNRPIKSLQPDKSVQQQAKTKKFNNAQRDEQDDK